MTDEYRVAISIPSTSTWEAEFGMSLIFLTNYCAAHGAKSGKPMHFTVRNMRGSILANMREQMVQDAIEAKATHVLFLDSDQTFPPDTLHRLLHHKKEVIGCNIAVKQIPSAPTARQAGNGNAGVNVYTTEDSPILEKVWRLGTGVMLIDLSIFKNPVLHKGPWFEQVWKPDVGSFTGEDWGFCRNLQKAGVGIWVDHDLSKEIGHLGNLNYGHDLIPVEAQEEAG